MSPLNLGVVLGVGVALAFAGMIAIAALIWFLIRSAARYIDAHRAGPDPVDEQPDEAPTAAPSDVDDAPAGDVEDLDDDPDAHALEAWVTSLHLNHPAPRPTPGVGRHRVDPAGEQTSELPVTTPSSTSGPIVVGPPMPVEPAADLNRDFVDASAGWFR